MTTRKTISKKSKPEEEWKSYEMAMFNDLYYVYRAPNYVVIPDVNSVIGQLSEETRQIDVAVFRSNDLSRPFLMVECKRHSRKLDVDGVGTFVSRVRDIKPEKAVLVCPKGFSKGAEKIAQKEGVHTHKLSLADAERLNWREIARRVFGWDEQLHPIMGDAFYAFNQSSLLSDWADAIEELPFEEWEAMFMGFRQIDVAKCDRMLRGIAQLHWSDEWRFNAIRLLNEFGSLDENFRKQLLVSEKDFETIELLLSFDDDDDPYN